MQRDNGLIGAADLADYRVKWREPMRISWRGNTVYTAPLPSSGGIALAQLLGIKEDRAADFKGVPLNSARYIHLLAEIENACSPIAPTTSAIRTSPRCRKRS